MNTSKNFEKWNEEMAKKYSNEERYLSNNFFIRWNTKKRLKTILDFLDSTKKDDVLEIGCGAGLILKSIKYYKSITGIDLAGSAVAIAKKNLASKKNVKIKKDDAQNLKLKGKYDKIICAEVLEHLPHPNKVIDNICKVAKKDSDIVITIPDEYHIEFVEFFLNLVGKSAKMDWHIHSFNLKLLYEYLEDKLEVIKVKRIPFFFFPFSYVVLCRLKE